MRAKTSSIYVSPIRRWRGEGCTPRVGYPWEDWEGRGTSIKDSGPTPSSQDLVLSPSVMKIQVCLAFLLVASALAEEAAAPAEKTNKQEKRGIVGYGIGYDDDYFDHDVPSFHHEGVAISSHGSHIAVTPAPAIHSASIAVTAAPVVHSAPVAVTAAPVVHASPVSVTAAPLLHSGSVHVTASPSYLDSPIHVTAAPVARLHSPGPILSAGPVSVTARPYLSAGHGAGAVFASRYAAAAPLAGSVALAPAPRSYVSEGKITAITIHREVPVPYPVPQPYPVHIEKKVPVPVRVEVPVDRPVPYPVPQPYPVHVDRPVHVPVPQPYPVHVDRPVPVPVDRHVPVAVPHPVPVTVERHVPVAVPQPYIVKEPVYVKEHPTYYLKEHNYLHH
ncbi:unnamed protein product [Nezara viridula]|uniref:Uncharacterized protein n=1 Tax=Nezara viridula TaxID=85310 RepID=A0A9P0GYB4_NEZVI|nr:unnamed protein product [Nezara viridula]